ncbi:unnamed protein product [Enterobius vermicularis]|uniref:CCHC-type domain-containing protein n=1 Tax=Enterobius vermicularis TaxID=51028 RepID=A0A0N4V854_ENTVE|nr:unnamed protein product [Enterobius vermicularis]
MSAFAIANKDYEIVVQALKEKYGSLTVIIGSLHDKLECLPHQPKNIQHTTATQNHTSAFSATASPAPESTERPTTYNIQKSEQKPQKRQPKTPCIFCSGMHWTTECHKYSIPQQRRELAKSKKLCFKCLENGHELYDCPQKLNCYYCKVLIDSRAGPMLGGEGKVNSKYLKCTPCVTHTVLTCPTLCKIE